MLLTHLYGRGSSIVLPGNTLRGIWRVSSVSFCNSRVQERMQGMRHCVLVV
jgi:hypothetical protein